MVLLTGMLGRSRFSVMPAPPITFIAPGGAIRAGLPGVNEVSLDPPPKQDLVDKIFDYKVQTSSSKIARPEQGLLMAPPAPPAVFPALAPLVVRPVLPLISVPEQHQSISSN